MKRRAGKHAHTPLLSQANYTDQPLSPIFALVQCGAFHPDMCLATTGHSDAVTVAINVDRAVWFEAAPAQSERTCNFTPIHTGSTLRRRGTGKEGFVNE